MTTNTDLNFSQTLTQIPSGDLASNCVLDQADEILEVLSHDYGKQIFTEKENLLESMALSLSEMRTALAERDLQLQKLSDRSDALARAQADAIIHSVEIIDELERTKQNLSDARLAAEEAANDTQRLADTIFERTHDGVLVLQNRTCLACNDNALELLACQRSEVLGRWPVALESALCEDETPAAMDLQRAYQAAVDGSITSTEVRLRKNGNSTFWASITMSAFDMKDAGHVLLVIRDISDHKAFEAELRRQRDFLDNVINAVPDQLSVKSREQTLVVANDAYCKVRGVERDAVIGKNANSQLSDEERERIIDVETQLLFNGKCQTIEQEFRQPDGSQRTASVKRSLFEDATSGELYFIETSRDITEDRVREDRLQLLASVFKGASEGVAILSSDGHVCEANPAFLKMLPAENQSPLGKSLSDVLKFEVNEWDQILLNVADGSAWSGKASVRDTNTSHRSYWISLSPSSEMDDRSTRIVALFSDITELENTQAKLRYQALYDHLTGLPNRRMFCRELGQLIEASEVPQETISVCFVDLDDFKHVNDSAGHSAGDRLLVAVGKRIQQVVGAETFVSRFGGDEFAIILTQEQALPEKRSMILNELIDSFKRPFQLQEMEAIVGLSIGVTNFPEHALETEALMCHADIAMYAAKASGKNQSRVFSPKMQASVNMRHKVQAKLSRALSEGEINLWFQPKVCSSTGNSAGCEALARWRTSDGTFIPPSEFIPVAEQTGLILPLGDLVFLLAAEQASEWFAAGHVPDISVNVSPQQLRHPRFVGQLEEILNQVGARAEWFELEITETAMMDDVHASITTIDNLAALGFRIAIDDFGTGYSSLSYLTQFRVHTLKIDLSFVRDVAHDSQSNAVVRSITSLGRGLNLSVVAEGVETAEQATVLADAGCTLLQGYHLGRPMPAELYWQWLESQKTERTPAPDHSLASAFL